MSISPLIVRSPAWFGVLLTLASAGLRVDAAVGQEPIRGFPTDLLADQLARESRAGRIPNRDTLAALMRRLTRGPHFAGTPASRAIAMALAARWRGYGLEVEVDSFQAVVPLPIDPVVELVAPVRRVATLLEPPLDDDPDTALPGHLPAFSGFSPDADVTAEVVYVNYGFQDDFRVLDSLGISVKGKIVLVRDGGMPSPKWLLAAERGAVACLMYHDPRDEGYFHGDPYPVGARRPETGIRSASVLGYEQFEPDGLPTGSENGRARPRIPVVPISARDALPILQHLTGPVAPLTWRGAHPVTYRLGAGGPARVRIRTRSDWSRRWLHNVVGTMPGARSGDQWILFGVHHDAIGGAGADDPVSGLVALDEAIRSLTSLRAEGWRPGRTLKFVAWDGEELGLQGSIDWTRRHREQLARSAVVYLNGDNVQAGWFRAQGPPSLQTFISEVIRDIPDPERGVSVLRAWQEGPGVVQPGGGAVAVTSTGPRRFVLAPIGMNNDVSPFQLEHGIPAMHLAYSGRPGPLGGRHSRYETYRYFSQFLDPGFGTVALLARTFATIALRFADAPLLPFVFSTIPATWHGQLDDIDRLARGNPALRDLNLGPVRRAVDDLALAAARFDSAASAVDRLSRQGPARWGALAEANQILQSAEQRLLDPDPPPTRRHNRHVVQGTTGLYSRTGVNPFPHLRRAVEDRPDLAAATAAAGAVEAGIRRYTERIDAAARAIRTATVPGPRPG